MNILHFSTNDISGGAAKAAYRLHSALRNTGLSSTMAVRNKQSDDMAVIQASQITIWQSRLRRFNRLIPFVGDNAPTSSSTYNFAHNFDVEPEIQTDLFYNGAPGSVDVICLHWITNLLTTKSIKNIHDHYNCPIVWPIVDQEPLTGGCHYSFGCEGFKEQCGNCPQYKNPGPNDWTRVVWNRKYKYLNDLPITIVAPTSWVADKAKDSSLFKDHPVEFIPLVIDTKVFRPFDKQSARDLLGVPLDKKVIFFGSAKLNDPRKGISLLIESLHKLKSMTERDNHLIKKEDIHLLIAGRDYNDIKHSLPFTSNHFLYFNDDITLALAYQAADVFLCSCVEDAGPMMIPEAMLCGTPVVAFNSGGAPDLIESMKTGYLAEYRKSSDLAQGVYNLLTAEDYSTISAAARETAEKKHSPDNVTDKYLKLFNRLCAEK